MKTKATKKGEIKRDWHLLDAQDQILGRLATQASFWLIGKNKPYYAPYLDCGDYVVVINTKSVKVSGKKEQQKIYYRHSGYPGGFSQTRFEEQMAKDPRKVILHAVSGMLPKNKLRSERLRRLRVFIDDKHPYQNQLRNKKDIIKTEKAKKDGSSKKDN